MIKPLEEMTKVELIEYAKDLRKTILSLHERFLAGLLIEIEAGELFLSDLDPQVLERFRKQLLKEN